ncbi:MAG: hypothetical protein H6760_01315 [Candidatus Nomurabacteria bacterium]|nr:MAG: hypothetical protein H6760_01315 [Candidatus Nomurabacteria bacterium]
MDYGVYLLLVIAGLELWLTIYIFTRYQRTKAIFFFGLFTACVTGWVLTNSIPLLFSYSSWQSDFLQRLSFSFAAFIFPFLYYYILLHPFPSIDINKRFILFTSLPAFFVSIATLFDKNFVIGFYDTSVRATIYGDSFWMYAVVMLLFAILIPVEIILKRRRLDGYYRYQFKLLFSAYLFSAAVGLLINLILPYFFDLKINYWLGPASSIIWVSMVWWVINRR